MFSGLIFKACQEQHLLRNGLHRRLFHQLKRKFSFYLNYLELYLLYLDSKLINHFCKVPICLMSISFLISFFKNYLKYSRFPLFNGMFADVNVSHKSKLNDYLCLILIVVDRFGFFFFVSYSDIFGRFYITFNSKPTIAIYLLVNCIQFSKKYFIVNRINCAL